MDFQGLKVGDFLLNRECKRTRARMPVNAGCDVKPGTDQNKIHMIYSEEVGQLISELSRELSTSEIALFSIVLSAEFGQKNLHSTENKSEKNINIKIFLQNLKCCSTTTKDLVISAEISEVNFIFNVILMFEISRLPATC